VTASALPTDEVVESFHGNPPEASDMDGLDLAVGEQLVQQAAAYAETTSSLGNREQQARIGGAGGGGLCA
jgi:hypothetical protein